MAKRALVSKSSETKCKAPTSSLQKTEHTRSIKSSALQAKLRIGQPNDIYEQEADRVAEQIMRMPDPVLQRRCPRCDEDEKKVLQTKKSSGQASLTHGQDVPPIVQDVLHSPGQPLDSATRAFFEPRFGYDFSGVRVHTDSKAGEAARTVNALAYTLESDLVFSKGQFSPDTNSGKMLLAHELAHVVQQIDKGSSKKLSTNNMKSPLIQCKTVCDELGGNCQSVPDEMQLVSIDPEIASLPGGLYVDVFQETYYDLSYRAEGGYLSNWLIVSYPDGTIVDINIYDFVEVPLSSTEVSNLMRQGYVGAGNRIFPRRLTPQTVPRLWAARQAAIEVMEQHTVDIITNAMPAVTFILSLSGGLGGPPRATARPMSIRPPIPIRGVAKTLTRQQMLNYLQTIWKRNPILQRLANAQRMTGEAQHRELLDILTQFEQETGVGVQRVAEGKVQAATQQIGNLASSRSSKGVLQIEEQVFKETSTLMNEVRHELAFFYAGGPQQKAPTLGETGINALVLLEGMIESGVESGLSFLQ